MEIVVEVAASKGSLLLHADQEIGNYLDKMEGRTLQVHMRPIDEISEKERLYMYWYKAIVPVMMEELIKDGWNNVDKALADHVLKKVCGGVDKRYNPKTDEEEEMLIDKKSLNKSELLRLVVDALHFMDNHYGREILSGQEYKERLAKQLKKNG